MVPQFDKYGLLPPGVHSIGSWSELESTFGWNEHRKRLLEGLKIATGHLAKAGCTTLYLDGSFVTDKEFPGDYDACYETSTMDLSKLHSAFSNFDNSRALQKSLFRGEFFPSRSPATRSSPFTCFFDFFQVDKQTGRQKGIIKLNPVQL